MIFKKIVVLQSPFKSREVKILIISMMGYSLAKIKFEFSFVAPFKDYSRPRLTSKFVNFNAKHEFLKVVKV